MSIARWSLFQFTYCVNMEKFLADEFNKYFSRNTYFFVTDLTFSRSISCYIYTEILTRKPLTEKRMQAMVDDAIYSGYRLYFQNVGYKYEQINGKKILLHSTKIGMRGEI